MISDHAGRAPGGLWRDRRGFSVFVVIYQGERYFCKRIVCTYYRLRLVRWFAHPRRVYSQRQI